MTPEIIQNLLYSITQIVWFSVFVLEILHNFFGQKLGWLSEIISLENRILCRGENMIIRPILITHVDRFDDHGRKDPDIF